MAQIIEISTQYQLANVVALIRSGRLGEVGERRILVVANNSFAPELTPAADAMPGSRGLLADFDAVIDWNAAIWPNHPKAFGISGERAPIMERALRREWGIGDREPVELIVESLPGHPAGALTQIFATAAISVHSDGLMSYGPIRNPLTLPQWQRLRAIFYTDLLPGITPRQLAEHDPDRVVLPTAELASVIDDMTAEVAEELAAAGLNSRIDGSALVLGQYLAQLDLITGEEELELHRQMIDAVRDSGLSTVIFKPHPTSARTTIEPLRRRCEEAGLDFVLADVPLLAEIVVSATRPELVVSCFSTGLATAKGLYGCQTAAVGTERLLTDLAPYQNSNRIPLTIVDALHSGRFELPDGLAGARDLNGLIDAVTYCMQPSSAEHLRGSAIDFLRSAVGGPDMKYFKRKRLTALDLPGRLQAPLHRKTLSAAKRRLTAGAKRTQRVLKDYGITVDASKLRKNG
ncbi:polysialyltransferase family glycosyltransferase [Brevibacterium renqingii]|uniref:polysialyltransferase family glycosyltransferase n=1 Tax=Brevibacterium renqingii TaxID=2776916 RepID=UPI001ADEF1F7|nr:polysialyltransferase family glycosyltransferase [Brevibacterium renqingii]